MALRPGLPRFCGGLAGYFGYDDGALHRARLAGVRKPGGIGTPDIQLLQTEELAVIDNLSGRLYLIVYADPGTPEAYHRGKRRLAELGDKLRYSVSAPQVRRGPGYAVEREMTRPTSKPRCCAPRSTSPPATACRCVLGQRLKKRYTESPLSLYRALRSLNPSPYMYYYDMGDFQIVGASPEILVRQERTPDGGQTVTLRPIAGTRPRGATPEQDKQLEAELLADPKERAEHVMLIDLARNDIGRIAETGSVKVTEAFGIERYSHVMHIVSNVEGRLKPGLSALDVLRATFPAGTLSGAPKIRAMEIIDELEPIERGIYGGACGYLSFAGDMDVAIAIRTGVVKDNTLYVQAGAGIVADSVPELEWQETEAKARALIARRNWWRRGSDHAVDDRPAPGGCHGIPPHPANPRQCWRFGLLTSHGDRSSPAKSGYRCGYRKRMQISRRDLYNRVWSTPMSKLARELDISDVGLAKACRRHNIPRPREATGPSWRRVRRRPSQRCPRPRSTRSNWTRHAIASRRRRRSKSTEPASRSRRRRRARPLQEWLPRLSSG